MPSHPISSHLAGIVFYAAVLAALLGIGLSFVLGETAGFGLLLGSVAFSLWAVWKTEHGGFVRTHQMRRAFEPERHFNGVQVILVLLLVMAQIGVGLYHLLMANG